MDLYEEGTVFVFIVILEKSTKERLEYYKKSFQNTNVLV